MADIAKYVDWALDLGSTAAPYEKGSLEVGNDPTLDDIRSGGALTVDLRQVVRKKPFVKATLLDPSLVTTWQAFGAAQTYTDVVATFRQYTQNGGLGSTYQSYTLSQGVLIPVSLSASPMRKATLDILAIGAFNAGSAFTVGTSSTTGPTVTKAYYPTNVVIGASTLTFIRQLQANWTYDIQDDEQLEPGYWYYENYALRGTAQVRNLDEVTAARLEDGTTETCTLLLTDANNGGNTVSINFGTCHVLASIKGDEATIEFEYVA